LRLDRYAFPLSAIRCSQGPRFPLRVTRSTESASHSDGARGAEIERVSVEPHLTLPWKSDVELKYRADGPLKNTLTDQFAYVERDVAVVFNGAFAFRFCDKRAFRQPLACGESLPPRLWLGG
jgi:hypothetical protein